MMTNPTPETTRTLRALAAERSRSHGDPRGKFHAHLTVLTGPDPNRVAALIQRCKPLKVKATLIDLADATGTRVQRDVMVTQHARDRAPGAVVRRVAALTALTRALDAAGYPVVRVKLEHEDAPVVARFDARRYHEVHVKLHLPPAHEGAALAWLAEHGPRHGAVPSRNPRARRADVVVRFVNLRLYSGTPAEADVRVASLLAELAAAGLPVAEVKRETVVFDTNQGVDQWWA